MSRYCVSVTDYTFADLSLEREILEPLDCHVRAGQCRQEKDLIELTAQADGVITQFAPLTENVIQAMTKARVIVRYGIGVDNVNLEAARQKKIPVCNIPTYCIDEVADQTLAFILGLTRSILPNHRVVEEGGWKLAVPLASMRTLKHLTVGVIGCGRIGQAVCQRLRPFGCRLLAFDPIASPDHLRGLGAEPVDLSGLLQSSDVVTLHCPSTDQTRGMIDRAALARMKPSALLINASRGDLIVTEDLVAALQSGHLGGAALDVTHPEPLPADSPLRRMENVILAAHIASASVQAVATLRRTAAEIIAQSLRGEPLPNVVNGVK